MESIFSNTTVNIKYVGLKALDWVTPGQRCIKGGNIVRGDPRGCCVYW